MSNGKSESSIFEPINITGDFKLTPEFLRDIVAKHTFHNSAAALRELIQNAHDACIVRCAIDGENDGAVDVLLDPQAGTITITDNGVGMAAQDIQDYLTTVGRGKKGSSIAEKYGIPDTQKNRLANVVGEFGFGFIASFIIADKIEIYTRHVGKDARSLKCTFSTSGIAYQIEEHSEQNRHGTKLVLHLNNEHRHPSLRPPKNLLEGSIVSYDTVEAVIKKYCLLLEFPITVTLQGEPAGAQLNVREFPWQERTNLASKVKAFYENRQGQGTIGELLLTIPFSMSKEAGDEINAEGIFVVDARNTNQIDEESRFGNLEVFVKRMWVCEGQRQLLPHWAWFVTGILVTPDLRPLPGRDGLETQHESFDRVKRALHRLLTSRFIEIAQRNPKLFAAIQDSHGLLLKAGLVMEREIADKNKRDFVEGEILRYIRLSRYSKKYLTGSTCTLNEYLGVNPDVSLDTKETNRRIYYVPRPVSPTRQREFLQLLTSQNVDVIVPMDPTESVLLVVINNTFKDLSFQSVEKDLLNRYAGILQGEQRDRWNVLLKYFNMLATSHHMKSADVGSFTPDYMPAMVMNVADEDKDEDDSEQPNKDKTDDKTAQESDALKATLLPHLPEQMRKLYSQTVVINTRNEAMKSLLEYKEKLALEQTDQLLEDCLHECYHLALLAVMDTLPAEWLRHHVEHQCRVISHYVESRSEFGDEQERSAKFQKDLDTKKDELKKQKDDLDKICSDLETLREPQKALSGWGINVEELLQVPTEPEERYGVVVVCDLVSSTANLLRFDFDDRGKVLNQFVDAARAKVRENGGFFDKFTGDGVLAIFGVDCPVPEGRRPDLEAIRKACRSAWKFQAELALEVSKLNDSPKLEHIRFRNPAVKALSLRIAIDAGLVSFGKYGGLGSAVGIPVIRAFRLCGEADAFNCADRNVLVTQEFADGYDAKNFEKDKFNFVPKGFNDSVEVFRWKQNL